MEPGRCSTGTSCWTAVGGAQPLSSDRDIEQRKPADVGGSVRAAPAESANPAAAAGGVCRVGGPGADWGLPEGSDSTLDKALLLIPELDHFLMQKPGEAAPLGETIEKLLALPG